MATDHPHLDPDDFGPDNPPRATVGQTRRYPQDDTHTPQRGVIYEGRVNNVTAAGNCFVALDKPWHASDVSGLLPEDNQLANLYREADEVYVMVNEVNGHGPVFQEVEMVGDPDRSSFAEQPNDEPSEGDLDDDQELPGEFADLVDDTDTSPDGVQIQYECPYCDGDDPFVDARPERVRRHITNSDHGNHKDRHGRDPSTVIDHRTPDGDDVPEDAFADNGREEGDISTSFVGGEYATDRDEVIVRVAMTNPSADVKYLKQAVAEQDTDNDARVSAPHVESVVADLPRLGSVDLSPEPWADREVLAKLYYYYGLSQRDIAARYDTTAPTISTAMSSMGINPGGQSNGEKAAALARVADDFGYEWAIDADYGAGDDESPDDDPLIPPAVEVEAETESESETETDPDPDPATTTAPETMDSTDTDDSDSVTKTTGNASYTGPETGLDLSTQTWDERPVKQASHDDQKWNDIDIADEFKQLSADELPSTDELPGTLTATLPENYRRLLTLIADLHEQTGEAPPRTEIQELPAFTYSEGWLKDQLRALDYAGLLDRDRRGRGGTHHHTVADAAYPDDYDPDAGDVDADESEAESEAADDQAADPFPSPDDYTAPAEEGDDDAVDVAVVDEADVAAVRKQAEALTRDAPSSSSGMAMYAKGMARTLKMLGLDGEADD